MQISYTTSEEDFLRAGLFMVRRKQSVFLRVLPWICGCVLAYALFLVIKGLIKHESAFANDTLLQDLLGPMLPLFIVLIPFFTRLNLRRQFRNNPLQGEMRKLQADFSGVHLISKSSSSDTAWSAYEAFAEDKNSFLLVQQGNLLCVPIPKREMSGAQTDELRALFEKYLPHK